MSQTVTYAVHHPWNRTSAPQVNRPYAELTLNGPNGAVRIWCLVDSGADRVLLDRQFGQQVGINFAVATPLVCQTASGASITVDQVANVSLTVEGKSLTDTCLFATSTGTPLLGRITALNAFDFGFDPHGWLHG